LAAAAVLILLLTAAALAVVVVLMVPGALTAVDAAAAVLVGVVPRAFEPTKCSGRKDSPVQNVQAGRIFQYTMFRQEGWSRTNCLVSRNIPAHNI
jgi:hypothetical protein